MLEKILSKVLKTFLFSKEIMTRVSVLHAHLSFVSGFKKVIFARKGVKLVFVSTGGWPTF